MIIDDPNDNTDYTDDAFADDHDFDPKADRGDEIVEDDDKQTEEDLKTVTGKDADKDDADGKDADKEDEEGKDEPERDEKGRFAKKDEEKSDDDDDDEEDGKDDKNYAIRINKLKEQRDAERAEIARLHAEMDALRQQTQAPKGESKKSEAELLDEQAAALYVKVEEARLDGNVADAAKLQRELDTINRKIATIEATQVATSVTVEQREAAQYDYMLGQLESMAPVLVPGTEEYDPAVVKELTMLVNGYESQGFSGPSALRKASTLLFGADPWGAAPAKKVEEAAPPAKAKAAEKKPDPKKAVEHSKKSPPDTSKDGTNVDSSKIDVIALDDEEFDALPESEKARRRGDVF